MHTLQARRTVNSGMVRRAGMSESKVAGIVGALSELEDKIDALHGRTGEAEKAIAAKAQSEIARLAEETRKAASKEAEEAVAAARAKAEAEAARIAEKGQESLAQIKSGMEQNFSRAVDAAVAAVLKA